MATDAEIIALADQSPLMHYNWPNRGVAKPAYIRGMAVVAARMASVLRAGDDGSAAKKAVTRATDPTIGSPDTDVLAWYSNELADAHATTATAEGRLVSLLAIMLGLGMRESSGRHCVGADTPEDRGEPTTEANAEAGLFQVSWDSIHHDPLRQALFDAYQNRTDLLDVFSHGVQCDADNWNNVGNAAGARFQNTMKKCPLFAALYTAQFLRSRRDHWGPINHKAAEVRADAVTLFNRVVAVI